MKTIYTSKGEEILVDDDNYNHLSEYLWHINSSGYAARRGQKSDGDRYGKTILMHREIVGAKEGETVVDHIDRNKLNNLESNLRIATKQQNQFNSKRDYGNSKYKGVHKKKNGTYTMQIQNGDSKVVLNFDDESCAAASYDFYAKKMFGEYALLNGVDIPIDTWREHVTTKWSNPFTSSCYKGVCLKSNGKWCAQIYANKKMKFIGYYDTEEEAALAYNLTAIDMFGEDAELNIIDSGEMLFKFTIMQRPLSKSNMYKARAIGKRAIIYTSREMEDFQIYVGGLAQQLIPKTLGGLNSIYTRCYSTKRLYDIDNPLKAILDSLDSTKKIKRGKKEILLCEGSGVENDRNFQLVASERFIVESAKEERVEVIIAPYKGLFHFANLIKETYESEEQDG